MLLGRCRCRHPGIVVRPAALIVSQGKDRPATIPGSYLTFSRSRSDEHFGRRLSVKRTVIREFGGEASGPLLPN